MAAPLLYRKRIIPEECIPLKDDKILRIDDEIIITQWNVLRPRKDFHHGFSCYFIKEGYKVSKFLKEDGSLMYWYCDIIKTDYNRDENSYLFTDLLADVIVYPDDSIHVVDIDEVAEALKYEKLPKEDVIMLLNNLNKLLTIIYSGRFDEYKAMINEYDS